MRLYVRINRRNGVKYLCIDERVSKERKLPKLSELTKEERERVISEVCREIYELKYVKGMKWSEVGDVYGVSKGTVISFYMRYCRKVR
jgi:Sigma-70, region 4.